MCFEEKGVLKCYPSQVGWLFLNFEKGSSRNVIYHMESERTNEGTDAKALHEHLHKFKKTFVHKRVFVSLSSSLGKWNFIPSLLDGMFDRFDGNKSCSVVFLGNDLVEKS